MLPNWSPSYNIRFHFFLRFAAAINMPASEVFILYKITLAEQSYLQDKISEEKSTLTTQQNIYRFMTLAIMKNRWVNNLDTVKRQLAPGHVPAPHIFSHTLIQARVFLLKVWDFKNTAWFVPPSFSGDLFSICSLPADCRNRAVYQQQQGQKGKQSDKGNILFSWILQMHTQIFTDRYKSTCPLSPFLKHAIKHCKNVHKVICPSQIY